MGESVVGERLKRVGGGKGGNEGVGGGGVGGEVRMMGGVGEDGFGKDILEKFRGNGVNRQN
ncbi:hypothetical protein, partial [Paenibacillus xylanexedens]|uniref:hypothetical protein n=1 Tax=Paenibacillus xylanexedens TaxID=528191 RepID=UPI001C9317B9